MVPHYVYVVLLTLAWPVVAAAQVPSVPAPSMRVQVKDTTRVEVWRFFEPQSGGGNPHYAFPANRLFAGIDYHRRLIDLTAGVQYVQFGLLPTSSVGPGPLGTGPQYFTQSGGSDSHQVYVRLLHMKLKNGVRGMSLQFGRFGYTSGAESASGDPKIEAVKRQRIDSRLIGEFEWSLYQRTFDGARFDVDRARWHAAASWLRPTQGGFEEKAGLPLGGLHVATATFGLRPSRALRHTDWQAFAYKYDDRRPVHARPDNSLLPAASADVHVTSVGGTAVGAYPAGTRAQVDVLVWLVAQRGRWYGQRHAADAEAAEVGYQRTALPWKPWLRGGWFRSSGDRDPVDGRHGTFFQMIPTARRYSLSTVYNLMNLTEVFGQALLRPRANVSLRVDVHRLRLSDPADLWYAGSGATERTGATFGFAGRRSNGSVDLGTMLETAADWTLSSHFSVNGYLGRMKGGGVVAGTFAGTHLRFGYVETIVSF